MQQALSDLRLISGVIGSFVFDPRKGLLASDVPAGFKKDKLGQAGRMVSRSITAGRTGFSEMKDLVFNFNEMFLLVRELRPGVILVVMGENSLNVNLLAMSLNLAAEDLVALSDLPPEEGEAPPPPAPAPAPVAAPVAAPAAPPPPPPPPPGASRSWTVESIKEDKNYGPVLAEIKAALAKVMGPMAGIILDDGLKAWIAAAEPSAKAIPALVDIICKDIGDLERSQKFKSLLAGKIGV
jgi:hypothetical protein